MKNIYGEEIEFAYEKNETMRLLGEQRTGAIFWSNDEVARQIKEISEARPCSFTLDAASDIFVLGYIHGKQSERARRRKTA